MPEGLCAGRATPPARCAGGASTGRACRTSAGTHGPLADGSRSGDSLSERRSAGREGERRLARWRFTRGGHAEAVPRRGGRGECRCDHKRGMLSRAGRCQRRLFGHAGRLWLEITAGAAHRPRVSPLRSGGPAPRARRLGGGLDAATHRGIDPGDAGQRHSPGEGPDGAGIGAPEERDHRHEGGEGTLEGGGYEHHSAFDASRGEEASCPNLVKPDRFIRRGSESRRARSGARTPHGVSRGSPGGPDSARCTQTIGAWRSYFTTIFPRSMCIPQVNS